MTETLNRRVREAIQAIRNKDLAEARSLLLAEIKENPTNLTAWLWAVEVADDIDEKRAILNKILSLDPNHQSALRYLQKLDQNTEMGTGDQIEQPGQPSLDQKKKKEKPAGCALGLLGTLPPSCGFIFLFAIIVAVAFVYFRVNTSFFGLVGTDFDNLAISNSYENIAAEDMYWEVQFEGVGQSKYIGVVRHVGPIRISEFRILTHDVLVTTADFANPDIVDANVVDHKFFWKASTAERPTGSINLIHALPANKEVYQELLKIQPWNTVKITGREIYTVKAYQTDGTFLGTWQDTGCNTLLIDTVTIVDTPSDE
jgi:hypothetical protein